MDISNLIEHIKHTMTQVDGTGRPSSRSRRRNETASLAGSWLGDLGIRHHRHRCNCSKHERERSAILSGQNARTSMERRVLSWLKKQWYKAKDKAMAPHKRPSLTLIRQGAAVAHGPHITVTLHRRPLHLSSHGIIALQLSQFIQTFGD